MVLFILSLPFHTFHHSLAKHSKYGYLNGMLETAFYSRCGREGAKVVRIFQPIHLRCDPLPVHVFLQYICPHVLDWSHTGRKHGELYIAIGDLPIWHWPSHKLAFICIFFISHTTLCCWPHSLSSVQTARMIPKLHSLQTGGSFRLGFCWRKQVSQPWQASALECLNQNKAQLVAPN